MDVRVAHGPTDHLDANPLAREALAQADTDVSHERPQARAGVGGEVEDRVHQRNRADNSVTRANRTLCEEGDVILVAGPDGHVAAAVDDVFQGLCHRLAPRDAASSLAV